MFTALAGEVTGLAELRDLVPTYQVLVLPATFQKPDQDPQRLVPGQDGEATTQVHQQISERCVPERDLAAGIPDEDIPHVSSGQKLERFVQDQDGAGTIRVRTKKKPLNDWSQIQTDEEFSEFSGRKTSQIMTEQKSWKFWLRTEQALL